MTHKNSKTPVTFLPDDVLTIGRFNSGFHMKTKRLEIYKVSRKHTDKLYKGLVKDKTNNFCLFCKLMSGNQSIGF